MKNNRNAFTLVELLVVISIIALLLAILMPSLNRARKIAQSVVCSSNMKNIGLAIMTYTEDYDQHYPLLGSRTSTGKLPNWDGGYPAPPYWDARIMRYMYPEYDVDIRMNMQIVLKDYGKMFKIWSCPGISSDPEYRTIYKNISDGQDSRATNYFPRSYRLNAKLAGHAGKYGPYSSRDFEDLSSNPSARAYVDTMKTTDVTNSSSTFLVVDGGLGNGSCFNNRYGWARTWSDVKPAHNVERGGDTFRDTWSSSAESKKGVSNITFADGHVDKLRRVYSEKEEGGLPVWQYGTLENRTSYKFYAGSVYEK